MSLRTDEKSWLIYDDESAVAVIRMLETYAMGVTGQKLARHPDQKIRAIGTMMVRLSETRGMLALQEGGAKAEAVEALVLLGSHLAGRPHDEVKCAKALDELHAVVFHVDSRAAGMGTKGPGVLRRLVRGD